MNLKPLIALAAAAASPALASEVNLAWDPSETPGITNYVLYAHTNALVMTNLSTASVRVPVGTNLTATCVWLKPGRYWFTVTAMRDGVESDPSNVVTVEAPEPPENMRTLVIQYSGTISNWTDVGFFKLRIPQTSLPR